MQLQPINKFLKIILHSSSSLQYLQSGLQSLIWCFTNSELKFILLHSYISYICVHAQLTNADTVYISSIHTNSFFFLHNIMTHGTEKSSHTIT